MNFKKLNLTLSIALAVAVSQPAATLAQTDTEARANAETRAKTAMSQAEQARSEAAAQRAESLAAREQAEARVEAEMQRALSEAHRSRSDAERAAAEARAEIVEAKRAESETHRQMSAERRAELEAMREQLTRAHRELRESSRELSQVNRELMLISRGGAERQIIISGGGQPVIGVILGDNTEDGVEILGLSPNGPAERAGLRTGDVIVAVAGQVLSGDGENDNARSSLNTALSELKASEPVIVSVDRGVDIIDVKVTPEVREPLTWQSVSRLPSVPTAPTAPTAPSAPTAPTAPTDNVFIERIEVQQLDREALTAQIARMEVEIEQREGSPHIARHWVSGDTEGYEYYFGDMSELGDLALSDTSAWYGLPLTSGLRLSEINSDLGAYFDTDRGVLVLSAKTDNALMLQAGDVVLSLQNKEVNSPADFMRALRTLAPGQELKIDIKRKSKARTLNPVISDEEFGFFSPRDFENFETVVSDSTH